MAKIEGKIASAGDKMIACYGKKNDEKKNSKYFSGRGFCALYTLGRHVD